MHDFFAALEEGAATLHGPMGDPLTFSSSLYTTVFSFARDKIKRGAPVGASLLGKMAERFLAGQNPTAFSFAERFGHVTEAIRTGQALDFVKPGEITLAREVGAFLSDPKLKQALDQIIAEEPNAQRRSFRMASHITNELSYRLITQFQQRVTRGNLIDAFQSFTGLLPVGFSVLPYLVAFGQQAPDRELLTHVARRFTGTVPQPLRNEKRAWFTDTLEDVNGVARTIRAMVQAARHAGADLTVVTSRSKLSITDIPIKNFPPVGEFEIPEYELQKLSFPPFLDMLDYIQRERFTELIISTPGPIGLCALGCAKLLGLRTSGIYHTDFPQYARFLSDDAFMESLVWNYMQWFYGQTDLVYVNSEFYRRRWIDRGIVPDKLRIFPRGLDTELFNPALRDPAILDQTRRQGPGASLRGAHFQGKGPQPPGRNHARPARKGRRRSRSPSWAKAPIAPSWKSCCPTPFSPASSADANSASPMPRPISLSSRAPPIPMAMSSWRRWRPACPWPFPISAGRANWSKRRRWAAFCPRAMLPPGWRDWRRCWPNRLRWKNGSALARQAGSERRWDRPSPALGGWVVE